MNHPFPYWLWTSHQSSLGSNQQTSFTFLCIWANTCLTDQSTYLFFKDLSFAVILVISRPLSNHSIEKNKLSLSPTAALLCWINRLQGYSIDQKDAWRHGHPITKPVLSRKFNLWHAWFTFMLLATDFFCARIASEAIPIGWIAPNSLRWNVWSDKRNLWRFQKTAEKRTGRYLIWTKRHGHSVTCVFKTR